MDSALEEASPSLDQRLGTGLCYNFSVRKNVFYLRLLAFLLLALSLGAGWWSASALEQNFESALLLRFLVAFLVAYGLLLVLMLGAARVLSAKEERFLRLRRATVEATGKSQNEAQAAEPATGHSPETADSDFFVASFFIICRTLFWFWSDGPRILVGLAPQTDHNLAVIESHRTKDLFYMILGATFLPAVMLLGVGGVLIVILRL